MPSATNGVGRDEHGGAHHASGQRTRPRDSHPRSASTTTPRMCARGRFCIRRAWVDAITDAPRDDQFCEQSFWSCHLFDNRPTSEEIPACSCAVKAKTY